MTTTRGAPPLDEHPPARTWLTPGDPYTTNDDRSRVSAAIDALTWQPQHADLLVPAMAAHAIGQAARQLGLPPLTHVAFDGCLDYPDASETASYALYGVECVYPEHGRARLYLLDTGTALVTLAHDVWPPTPADTTRSWT